MKIFLFVSFEHQCGADVMVITATERRKDDTNSNYGSLRRYYGRKCTRRRPLICVDRRTHCNCLARIQKRKANQQEERKARVHCDLALHIGHPPGAIQVDVWAHSMKDYDTAYR